MEYGIGVYVGYGPTMFNVLQHMSDEVYLDVWEPPTQSYILIGAYVY